MSATYLHRQIVTYGLILDPVDSRVQVLRFVGKMMFNLSDFEDSSLLECPGGQLLSKLPVGSLGFLII